MQYYTLNDYRSRYDGTYVGLDTGENVVPIHIHRCQQDADGFFFEGCEVRTTGSDGSRIAIRFNDERLSLHPPVLGMVHERGTLCYVSRKPHRRWKQGLSIDSTDLRWYVRSPEREIINVYRLFVPEYLTLEEALVKGCEGRPAGFAVTKYLGIISTGVEGECAVVYRSRAIGKYSSGTSTLLLNTNANVLIDTMRRAGFNNVQIQEE
jgi:hypothetical protein